jgi:hypothetical protein
MSAQDQCRASETLTAAMPVRRVAALEIVALRCDRRFAHAPLRYAVDAVGLSWPPATFPANLSGAP